MLQSYKQSKGHGLPLTTTYDLANSRVPVVVPMATSGNLTGLHQGYSPAPNTCVLWYMKSQQTTAQYW
jgi:hypothetical protein